MLKDPVVTVIVPTLNNGNHLSEALASVAAQSFTDWECIIVDDGSSDNTKEIAEGFCNTDKRFRYVYQQNSGTSFARNNGIARAKGKYIQFLDGDDLLQTDKIKPQVDFLESTPQADIIYGSSRYFFDGEPEELFPLHYLGHAPAVELHYKDTHQLAAISKVNVSTICATLYRKKIFEKVPGFKTLGFEDWLFHIECSLAGYRFHFERFDNGYCLIRMSSRSQMNKHRSQFSTADKFPATLKRLLDSHNYVSPLLMDRSFDNKLKRTSKLFIPPIFLKIFARIKRMIYKRPAWFKKK